MIRLQYPKIKLYQIDRQAVLEAFIWIMSQSRSQIVIHSGALDTFVQREAGTSQLRPLRDDWTDEFCICRVIGQSNRGWVCLNSAVCQRVAGGSRGSPCYTTDRQQPGANRASTGSLQAPPLHPLPPAVEWMNTAATRSSWGTSLILYILSR